MEEIKPSACHVIFPCMVSELFSLKLKAYFVILVVLLVHPSFVMSASFLLNQTIACKIELYILRGEPYKNLQGVRVSM